jgi:enoyl-CoA hydratase/carnithine racemase
MVPKPLDEYADAYANVRFDRQDGILQVQLHSNGGPLVWEDSAHRELPLALMDIATDPENEVVILTGTGDSFCATVDHLSWGPDRATSPVRDRIYHEAKIMLRALLDIHVPVIGAVNGPARLHAEVPLLSDVVLASDTAVFQDAVHWTTGGVPGDGVHVLWPMWLGPNRGRQFLYMCQEIDAREALSLGLVAEVHPPERLLDRAWEIAREFLNRPRTTRRYTRVALTLGIRRALEADLNEGLALEFLARALTVADGAGPGPTYPYITPAS